MAVVKGRVEPINMVEGPASLSSSRIAAVTPNIFSVDNQVVSFPLGFPVIATKEDEILVAGTIKEGGILHATAYENLTRAVGKSHVLPSLVMTSLYVSSALTIPFFLWVMIRIGADFSEPAFMAIAFVVIGSLLGPIFLIHAYNQRMQRDAQELATYARDHLLSRRD